MKFKHFFKKYTFILLPTIISLLLGIFLGTYISPTEDYLNSKTKDTNDILVKIDELEPILTEKEATYEKLKEESITLEDEKEAKVKIEQQAKAEAEAQKKKAAEQKAKEEAEAKLKAEAEEKAKVEAEAQAKKEAEEQATSSQNSSSANQTSSTQTPITKSVWITATGSKYHRSSSCGNSKNASQISLDEAEACGYTPCKKCY